MVLHDSAGNFLILTLLALVLYAVASFRAGGALDFGTVSAASPRLVLVALVFAFAAMTVAIVAFAMARAGAG